MAADTRAECLRLGKLKPGVDVLIAGTALSGDHVLITCDRDFSSVADSFGLRLEAY